MKNYARIENGMVVELLQTNGDITKMFNPALVWVECTVVIGIAVGWTYAKSTFATPAAPPLAQVQAAQIAILTASYNAEIQLPVSYMATTFQADSGSQDTLTKCLVPGAVSADFGWWDVNNVKVPMTFTQLQGLAGAMLVQGQAAFVKLQTLKAQVRSATTIAAVQAVVW